MEIKYITTKDLASLDALNSFKREQILALSDRDAILVFDYDDNAWAAYYNTTKSPDNGHHHRIYHSVLRNIYNSCWGLYYPRDLLKVHNASPATSGRVNVFIAQLKDMDKKANNVELGVELELESKDCGCARARNVITEILGPMLESVVSDDSVYGGTEIRFSHPELKDWDKEKVKAALAALRKAKFNHKNGTAGMHIHMSSGSQHATRRAQERCELHSSQIKEILYPICARPAYIRGEKRLTDRYGLGRNFARIFSRRGTLEIRVWEATTNPRVFMARLKFADYFFRFLMSDLSFDKFFSQMTKRQKQNYAFLVKTQNPHAFGMGKDAALALLNTEA